MTGCALRVQIAHHIRFANNRVPEAQSWFRFIPNIVLPSKLSHKGKKGLWGSGLQK